MARANQSVKAVVGPIADPEEQTNQQIGKSDFIKVLEILTSPCIDLVAIIELCRLFSVESS